MCKKHKASRKNNQRSEKINLNSARFSVLAKICAPVSPALSDEVLFYIFIHVVHRSSQLYLIKLKGEIFAFFGALSIMM